MHPTSSPLAECVSTVYIVDDDDAVRKTLARSLKYNNHTVESYASGRAFLDAIDERSYGCVILDIAMPGLSGLEVQSVLAERGIEIPVIFITGHGDIPTSVHALKGGAIEFLEKPYPLDLMFERVVEALKIDEARCSNDKHVANVKQRFDTLTKREATVMVELVSGQAHRSNKEVARALELSHRTVEEYRSRIFTKMEASSITHLVEIAKICGVYTS